MANEMSSTSRRGRIRARATDCDREESGEEDEGAQVKGKEEKIERLLEVQGRQGSLRLADPLALAVRFSGC